MGRVVLACVLLVATLHACTAQRWMKSWSYNCTKSVYDWPADFNMCAKEDQSPINILTLPADLKNFRPALHPLTLESHFYAGAFSGVLGPLLELTVSKASTDPQFVRFLWDDKEKVSCAGCDESSAQKYEDYILERIALHHPSEHTIDGKRFPVEVQFYLHKANSAGDSIDNRLSIAVLGVITSKQFVTPVVRELTGAINDQFTDAGVLIDNFNPAALLPNRAGFFMYNGTDTAPPCEPMRWAIMEHTVNFTKEIVTAVQRQIQRFHPNGNGNARPGRADQERLQMSYYPSDSVLLKATGVAMSHTQFLAFADGTLRDMSILEISKNFLYTNPYDLKLSSQCQLSSTRELDLPVEPNTHPDILRLRPDISLETMGDTKTVPPKVNLPRVAPGQPQRASTIPRPRLMFAQWTNSESQGAADVQWKTRCETWQAKGSNSSSPDADFCNELFARLPHDSWIFAKVPMPPLPPKPEPRFLPHNFPISPGMINNPSIPDLVDPYAMVPTTPFDPNNPMSGPDPFMHKPNGQPTTILKPTFIKPPAYADGSAQ